MHINEYELTVATKEKKMKNMFLFTFFPCNYSQFIFTMYIFAYSYKVFKLYG